MGLWLPAHVHAVRIDEDLVFLDERADAYLCLVGAAHVLALGADGGVSATDEEAVQALIEEGLLAEDPGPARSGPPPKARIDLDLETGPASRAQVVALSRACLTSAHDLRRCSFAGLLARARARRGRLNASDVDPEAVVTASKAFRRMRPWAPIGGACLQRSYLMLAYLHNLGLDADWVIGVRTWPFMAHCWLQAGGVSLEEDAERLVAYSPILAVR